MGCSDVGRLDTEGMAASLEAGRGSPGWSGVSQEGLGETWGICEAGGSSGCWRQERVRGTKLDSPMGAALAARSSVSPTAPCTSPLHRLLSHRRAAPPLGLFLAPRSVLSARGHQVPPGLCENL